MRFFDNSVLVVPPFDCAWLSGEDLKFGKAGRGCVSFEARADNDVTVVFKEQAGCKHYRTDTEPNYTVILGSHLNRRFKIEVNGQTVVDIAGIVLSPSVFEKYWISIEDGMITVGKGEPGRGVVYQWIDLQPNCKVQYVGLSSWDKHVGYRNIRVLPPPRCNASARPVVEVQGMYGVAEYLENEEFADIRFVVGKDERIVPAHRVLLAACCSRFLEMPLSAKNEIILPSVDYPILHALLQYIYMGRVQVESFQSLQVQNLAKVFGLQCLVSQCEQLNATYTAAADDYTAVEGSELASHIVEMAYPIDGQYLEMFPALSCDIVAKRLSKFLAIGEYCDIVLFLDDCGVKIPAHRIIMSIWSRPISKMFTNGMMESSTREISFKDVHQEAFIAMVQFMYSGHFELDQQDNAGSLLLPLLVLADQFSVRLLQKECSEQLHQCLTEDSVCAILQVAASIPACETLREACEECCAKHFDYCISAPAAQFRALDNMCLMQILQHPNLWVTSEERVLDAVLMWAADLEGIFGWEDADMKANGFDSFSGNRVQHLKDLLLLVRFPLMPMDLLHRLEGSSLSNHIPIMKELVKEALQYLRQDLTCSSELREDTLSIDHTTQGRLVSLPRTSLRFSRRLSNLKELFYMCDGDGNGVLQYSGTSYGQHPWMNPVLIKRILVSSSSPFSRYTDPKAIVSGKYQCTSFAGPCMKDGRYWSWWKIDLGVGHQLMCNYYSVRQDGSTNFMRGWIFQGSVDEEQWTDLKVHRKDQTICRPGQYASWPVHGAKSLLPFRFFRILLIDSTACASTPWNLSLCYIELYGYFR
ncbi:hypothetical protein O6H91_22G061000 [Diphasiastrum complanatum]|uniref:Uncharacterized protein n=3 Tax=Diphasiastrum complanatum TaxID=34168 RepID=A0ACC2AG55_DIPCM|nr:hypothetical protein O6H91_22G061000 [Diphasiastrum complanatum]KAJ7516514.1 hypothetical protein O6H91_22G061000 [Diphasiastrum complanatum]KAJ7516515.1 hypothetical protein O6H91_22G061000 [Diphasiastrum complanatum]